MNSMKDDSRMQEVVNNIFPALHKMEANTSSISIAKNKRGESLISILLICDDMMIEDFIGATDVESEIKLLYEPNLSSHGVMDLIIKLDFYFSTGHPMFELLVSGIDIKQQKKIAQAMHDKSKITAFIVNKDLQVEVALRLELKVHEYYNILEKIINLKTPPKNVCKICGKKYETTDVDINFICYDCESEQAMSDYDI